MPGMKSSSLHAARQSLQQLPRYAPEPAVMSEDDEDDDAFESAESESGCGSLPPTSEESESVRMRVRRKILQRVQELHVAFSDDSDAQLDAQIHSYSAALHAAQQERPAVISSDSPEADEQLNLEHLRADVINVAVQILERHLSHHQQQQKQTTNQNKRGYKHENGTVAPGTLELRLVHRMLAKESELLALQALRQPVRPSGADAGAGIAVAHGRKGGRQMDAL